MFVTSFPLRKVLKAFGGTELKKKEESVETGGDGVMQHYHLGLDAVQLSVWVCGGANLLSRRLSLSLPLIGSPMPPRPY